MCGTSIVIITTRLEFKSNHSDLKEVELKGFDTPITPAANIFLSRLVILTRFGRGGLVLWTDGIHRGRQGERNNSSSTDTRLNHTLMRYMYIRIIIAAEGLKKTLDGEEREREGGREREREHHTSTIIRKLSKSTNSLTAVSTIS